MTSSEDPRVRKPRLQPGVERPRDRFGRPLAWNQPTELELHDHDNLSLEENHRLAIEAFNAGVFFSAHEAWEGSWRVAHDTPDEEFFKGLAQLGAGYTHMQRGNPRGAKLLLSRALERVSPHRPAHHGIDLDALCATLESHIATFAADEAAGREATLLTPPPID